MFGFGKTKYVKGKKQLVQDLIPPPSIYIHMFTLYMYTNICMPRFSPSGFFGPSRCRIPTPGPTSEYPICAVCVCVCVRIHTPTHTYTPTRVKNREDTDNTPISPSVENNLPRQATSAFMDYLNPSILVPPMLNETNCTYMRACAHPVASVKQMCTLMFATSV